MANLNAALEILNLSERTDLFESVSPTNEPVSNIIYFLAACYLAGVTVIGMSFNGIVIFLMFMDASLHTPINFILLNLALADSGIAFLGNPVAFYNAVNRGWMFGPHICVIYGFGMSLFGICSIFTLTFLAYHRYILICYPLNLNRHLSWTKAKLGAIGTWMTSFLVSFPPLFGWGGYDNEAANISCSINWDSRGWNPTTYIMFLFVVGLGFPMLCISFSYARILQTLKRVKIMQDDNAIRTRRKADTHVAKMIFIMAIAFLIAWGPYAIFSLLVAFTNIELSESWMILPSLFAKSSVCYNPIIYFFLNNQFKNSFLRYFPRRDHLDSDDRIDDSRPIQLTIMMNVENRVSPDLQNQTSESL